MIKWESQNSSVGLRFPWTQTASRRWLERVLMQTHLSADYPTAGFLTLSKSRVLSVSLLPRCPSFDCEPLCR